MAYGFTIFRSRILAGKPLEFAMLVPLESTTYLGFSTRNKGTGNPENATGLPVATVYENGVLIGTSPANGITVTNLAATGQYSVSIAATAANGYEKGKTYIVHAAATVSGESDETPIGSFRVGKEVEADDQFFGIDFSNLMTYAAVGAGIGKVSGAGVAGPHDETFRLPDDSADAFVVTVDDDGNRTSISIP